MATFLHIPVVDKSGLPVRHCFYKLRVGSKFYQKLEELNGGVFPRNIKIVKPE